jgi:hypothetical protein
MNLYQPTITGSLSVSGSVNISGSITIAGGGTISGTASIATTALTASSADNFLVRNTLTAQTLVVQTITSSVDFVTGSTRFGSLSSDTMKITGSVSISGSMIVTSSALSVYNNSASPYISVTSGTGSIAYMQAVGNTEVQFGDLSSTYSSISLYTGGTRRVFISGSGLVGIGTTTPSLTLHVNKASVSGAPATSSITPTGYAVIGSGFNNNLYMGSYNASPYGFWLQAQDATNLATNYPIILNPNGGSVGIGVSNPNHALAVNGSVGFYSTTPAQKWHIQYASSVDGLNFVESGVADYRMFIKAGGNVGIGNSSPNTTLSIKGAASTPTALTYNGMFGLESAGQTSFQMGIGSAFNGTWFQSYNQPAGGAGNFVLAFNPLGGSVAIGNYGYTNYRLNIRGADATSANYSFRAEDSGTNTLFECRNDGVIFTGTQSGSPYNNSVTGRDAYLSSSGVLGYLSSTRESKINIESIKSIDFINQLNPVRFNYRKNNSETNEYTDEFYDNINYGFIADEVEKVNKDLVFYKSDGTTLAGVEYNNMIAILTKAIQELKAEFDTYKTTHP